MKSIISVLILAFSAVAVGEDEGVTKQQKEDLVRAFVRYQSFFHGYGSNAVPSPFGRYLLVRKEDQILALKLEKHLPSKTKPHFSASTFSWILFKEKRAVESGKVTLDEPEKKGSDWIRINGFEIEWSSGDWIYLNDKIEVSITEAIEPNEIFSGQELKWFKKTDIAKRTGWDTEETKLLQRALGLEQGGAGQPATRPVVEPEDGDKPQPVSEGRSR
jgi:hypothetical protein